MAKAIYEENDIKNIADSIRSVNGLTDTYKVSEMSTVISSLNSSSSQTDLLTQINGSNLETLDLTQFFEKIKNENISVYIRDYAEYKNPNIKYIKSNPVDMSNETYSSRLFLGDYGLSCLPNLEYIYLPVLPAKYTQTLENMGNDGSKMTINQSMIFYNQRKLKAVWISCLSTGNLHSFCEYSPVKYICIKNCRDTIPNGWSHCSNLEKLYFMDLNPDDSYNDLLFNSVNPLFNGLAQCLQQTCNIYIDKPRSSASSYAMYQYKFAGTDESVTSESGYQYINLIFNDDEAWTEPTEEEFWSYATPSE